MVSEVAQPSTKGEKGRVLILVLVEDGLGAPYSVLLYIKNMQVLILVLVEDGLGVLSK